MDNDKINIADLLKDSPKGTKLYSPLFGEVEFDCIEDGIGIKVDVSNGCTEIFYSNGRFYNGFTDAECLLFPSKDQRDWSKFVPPCMFKDGDIVATTNGLWIGITTGGKSSESIPTYCVTTGTGGFEAYFNYREKWKFQRLATEEEKQILFDAIKSHGYVWNAETKTLEKLPKLKVGDRVKKNKDYISGIITDIFDDSFKVTYDGGGCSYVQFHYQDDWELVPTKFDVTTLKAFDKVLCRDKDNEVWSANIYSHYDSKSDRPFVCIGWNELNSYITCVPYEKNEHLLGTTNDCDEYYKNW